MDQILFVIPAKSSSSRIKKKNMKKLGNTSLLGHKIRACLKTNLGRVIVSTDSKKIADYSVKLGAEVPFLRPKKYSSSVATMMSCVLNLITYFKKNLIKYPKYIAVLPPTFPFTKASSITKAFNKLRSNKKYNSICSFTDCLEHPFLIIKNKKKMHFNVIKYNGHTLADFERTQDYPQALILSGAIRITKISYFLKYISNFSPKTRNHVSDFNSCLGFKLNKKEALDINDHNDFNIAKILLKNKNIWNH